MFLNLLPWRPRRRVLQCVCVFCVHGVCLTLCVARGTAVRESVPMFLCGNACASGPCFQVPGPEARVHAHACVSVCTRVRARAFFWGCVCVQVCVPCVRASVSG